MVAIGTLAMFIVQGLAPRVGKAYVVGGGLTIAVIGFIVEPAGPLPAETGAQIIAGARVPPPRALPG